jgi:NADH dehydrogenase (ubiquinone) Fe-S protein 3
MSKLLLSRFNLIYNGLNKSLTPSVTLAKNVSCSSVMNQQQSTETAAAAPPLSTKTVKTLSPVQRTSLIDIGKYISENLPKYTQIAQVTSNNELEILIHPDGVVPVLSFLRENHRTQFHSFIDITAVDVPSRQYRFEVSSTP